MNRILRGDAVATAQIWHLTPANVEVGDTFRVTINGKLGVEFAATAATVANVTAGFTAAWNASIIAEFSEITATDAGTHVVLTASTAGTPFWLTTSTVTGSTAAGSVAIVETTPGVEAVNEVQKVELVGTYTGGTFTIAWDFGSGAETTGAIAYNATAATVQTAIEALATPVPGDVVVTGGPGPDTPWFVTFSGALAATEIAAGTINGTNLTGTAGIGIETTSAGGGVSDEIQRLTLNAATAGTYTLSFGGETTAAIAYNATAGTIQTALQGLSTIGSGNVLVYGGRGDSGSFVNNYGFFLLFAGTLAATNVGQVAVDYALLTGTGQTGTISAGGQATRDEYQFIDLGEPTAGTYTLTFDGQTTAAIDFDASPSNIRVFLEALSNLSTGDIAVYVPTSSSANGGVQNNNMLVRFQGSKANADQPELTVGAGSLTSANTPTVTTVHPGGGSIDEIQSVTIYATGGTFTLTFDGQTTAATAYNASAATLTTNLEALSTITDVTVSGTGTPADPYLVTFVDPGDQDVALMTGDPSSLTGGGGKTTETVSHSAGTDEVQTITVTATAGTYTLAFDGATTGNIAYNAAASAVETALEALATIAGISVSGSAGGPYTVTFDVAPLDKQDVALISANAANLTNSVDNQTFTATEITRSGGPNHFDSARNWEGNRVPDSGDDLIIDNLDVDLLYGLRMRTTFTAATSDLVTFAETDVAFVEDQIVRLRTTNTLPAGLSVDTDYYIIDLDHLAGTCKLSATSGGAAVDITDTGTGTHTIAFEFNSLTITNRYSGLEGLPQRTASDYWEYRPGYLECGVISPSGGVNKLVTIGGRDGSGSGRLKLDLAGYAVDVVIYDAGGSVEPGVNAVQLLLDHASANVTLHEGDLGIAALAGESAELNDYTQHGGQCDMGTVVLNGDLTRHGGEFVAENLTMSGSLLAR